MLIYKTTDGQKFDFALMPKEHREFLTRAYWHYCTDMQYEDFIVFILGPNSPVLDPKRNGPVPTRTPLYEVATDLQGRLGVKQGLIAQDWEGEVDPAWPLND